MNTSGFHQNVGEGNNSLNAMSPGLGLGLGLGLGKRLVQIKFGVRDQESNELLMRYENRGQMVS